MGPVPRFETQPQEDSAPENQTNTYFTEKRLI